jgi:hypothetical protein
MRLSQWRKAAPTAGAMNDRVLAVVGPVLSDLGAERDPECWVAWGEDPDLRYSLLAPTLAGLITVAIRFANPEEGPRVIAKLIRWSKVSVSELGLDAGGGHRMVAVQVENMVLKGMDEEADRICDFVRILIAGVDDRLQMPTSTPARGGVAVVAAPSVVIPPRASLRTVARGPAPVVAARRPAAQGAVSAGSSPAGADAPPDRPRAAKAPKATKPTAPKAAGKRPAESSRTAVAKALAKPAAAPIAPAAQELSAAASATPAPSETAISPDSSPPTPIADRAAARNAAGDAEPAGTSRRMVSETEGEPDRSGWVSPHPIEEPVVRKPAKPRTWMP